MGLTQPVYSWIKEFIDKAIEELRNNKIKAEEYCVIVKTISNREEKIWLIYKSIEELSIKLPQNPELENMKDMFSVKIEIYIFD